MTLHSFGQVEIAARAAGFTNKDAEVFAAVCLAESIAWSGGKQYADDTKIGDTHLENDTWGPSVGVPQIRTQKKPPSNNYNYDWLYGNISRQMTAAYALFKVRGFKPWSAYNNGSYLGYMPATPKFNPAPIVPDNQHLILGGQSLSAIAQSYRDKRPVFARFSWQALALANGLGSPYWIYAGKTLKLPTWAYTVATGDNLSSIAERLTHLTWQELAKFNQLVDPNALAVGQVLWIPDQSFITPA